MLRLLLFVLPLALDSFAISAALGARRPSRRQRWRLSALFVLFEAGMPLVGLAVGAPLAHLIGSVADVVAAAAFIGVGLWMVLEDDDEARLAERVLTAGGWASVALGLSMSVDELAIGFSLGLARLPDAAVIVAIAVQTVVASQLGLALGARIGEAWRERAAKLAGVLLILLGVGVAIERLVG